MATTEITTHIAVCDHCYDDTNEYPGYEFEDEAIEAATDDGWKLTTNNELLCPNCQ